MRTSRRPAVPAMIPRLVLTFADRQILEAELEENLVKGRTFIAGAVPLELRSACELALVHPETDEILLLKAEVVWAKADEPGQGVGVELKDVDTEILRAFVGKRGPAAEARRAQTLYDRVRSLNIRERDTWARQGTLAERVALERCYGPAVWEALLHNAQLTPPEVARIAKNGTLPRPLAGVIVGNAAWVRVPEIQRALLGNPRVLGPHLDRILQLLSPAELKRVAQQTAYRPAVRAAALKLVK
jgi:hypothetical protein